MVCLSSLFTLLSFAFLCGTDLLVERDLLYRSYAFGWRGSFTRVAALWLWAARLVFSAAYDSVVSAILGAPLLTHTWCWIVAALPATWFSGAPRLAAGAGMDRLDFASAEVHAGVHAHVMGSVGLDEHEVPLQHFLLCVGIFYVVRFVLRKIMATYFYSVNATQMLLQRGLLSSAKVAEGEFSPEDVSTRAFLDFARLRADHFPMVLLLSALWGAGLVPHYAFSALMWLEWAHAWTAWRVDAALGARGAASAQPGSRAACYWAARSPAVITMRDTPSPSTSGWLVTATWFIEPALMPLAMPRVAALAGPHAD